MKIWGKIEFFYEENNQISLKLSSCVFSKSTQSDCVVVLLGCETAAASRWGHSDTLFPDNHRAASSQPDFWCLFLMLLTSRSADSPAVMFWDTFGPDQHSGNIWHVESCGLNNFLPCMLLWTQVIGTCLQDYLWLNHSARHLQGGGNWMWERVKLLKFALLAASVC